MKFFITRLSEPARSLLLCILLVLGIVIGYSSVTRFEFVDYDDNYFLSENFHVKKGLTTDGIVWAFSNHLSGCWDPFTWITHMLDWQVFGNRPGMHHVVNVLFHILNSLLLFVVLKKMTGAMYRSFFVAAFFAFHPLHVESVVWISERKDMLSALFFLLALLAYREYTLRAGWRRYGLVLLAYVCGLMSKPMVVTFPFVLLLLDCWPLKRFAFEWNSAARCRFFSLVKEKAPFFLLSAIICVVTYSTQKKIDAVYTGTQINLWANAAVSYMLYLVKMVYPATLAVLYPLPRVLPAWEVGLAIVFLISATGAVLTAGRRRGFLLTGWFWYVGMLVPVIGIIQVGVQEMADRYTYLPFIGMFIIIVWGTHRMAEKNRVVKIAAAAAGCACLVVLPYLTRCQAAYWQNTETLFSHAVAVTKNNYYMLNSLGIAYAKKGKYTEAEKCFREIIRENQNFYGPFYNLGEILFKYKKFDEAVSMLKRAVLLDSSSALAYGYLGRALEKQGHIAEAMAEMRKAVRLDTTWIDPLNSLCWYLATSKIDSVRKPAEAVALSERLCRLTNNSDPCFLDTKAAALASAGDFSGAVALEEKAVAMAKNVPVLAKEIDSRLRLFREKKPFIE